MSKKTVTTCDCGCGVTDEKESINWFTLSNRNIPENRIEIESPLHFANLECLNKWSSKAITTARKMEEYIRSDDYEGGHFDGWSFGEKDDSMRKLVVPCR